MRCNKVLLLHGGSPCTEFDCDECDYGLKYEPSTQRVFLRLFQLRLVALPAVQSLNSVTLGSGRIGARCAPHTSISGWRESIFRGRIVWVLLGERSHAARRGRCPSVGVAIISVGGEARRTRH